MSNFPNPKRLCRNEALDFGILNFNNCCARLHRCAKRCGQEFRISNFEFPGASAFTIVELLVVIAVIIVLVGLILTAAGYIQNKGARSRAETEIAAISAALENYRADNGIYPRDMATTDNLDPRSSGNPTNYQAASLFLYDSLFGSASLGSRTAASGAKSYFVFKPYMLSPANQGQNVQYIRDPFGNSYGYSTAYQKNPTTGYNPTFDLWSTAGNVDNNTPPNQTQWIKNW
jgi:type II secretory pathway pseudopilin PulG